MIPGISVAVRRLHDSNKCGWYLLFPVYNLYLLIKDGDECLNNYDED